MIHADRLAGELEGLDWPEGTVSMQRAWIGRSEGAQIEFGLAGPPVETAEAELRVFTTRPDTLMGATYAGIAPEHPLAAALAAGDSAEAAAVAEDVQAAAFKSDMDRTVGDCAAPQGRKPRLEESRGGRGR